MGEKSDFLCWITWQTGIVIPGQVIHCGSLRDQNFDIQALSAEQMQKAAPNKEIHFVIEDNGSGVSEDGIAKLAQRKQGISENPVL